MGKYDIILRKFNRMNRIMTISIFGGLITGVLAFLYTILKYGALSNKVPPTIFITMGIVLGVPFIAYLIIRLFFGKYSVLIHYNKKPINEAIDYMLNGDSYNTTIKTLNEHIDKFSNGKINKENLLKSIISSHYGEHRGNILNHIYVMKISKIIKKLKL